MSATQTLAPRHWLIVLVVSLGLFLPGFFNLPPTDRDESRYIVTSERMAETGDIVDLRYQEAPRYLQPAGIYWLQALSTTVFDSPARDSVWSYRIPSVLGALIAVLLTAFAGARFFNPIAGVTAAVMLAACFSLNFEARIAKTDAALLAAITVAQVAMMRAYLDPAAGRWNAVSYWAALGVGLMIKGPVVLLVSGSTFVALWLWERRIAWAKALRPTWGPLITLAIALPWFIAIGVMTDGEFYERALFRNFLGKVNDGEQGHSGPFGYHAALLLLTFWPASLLALGAVPFAWRQRTSPIVRYLLCWIIPTWIIFEFVATKLPHYVLPTFPALALLATAALHSAGPEKRGVFTTIYFALITLLWIAASALLAALAPVALYHLEGVLSPLSVTLGAAAFGIALAALWFLSRRDWPKAIGAMTFAAALIWTNTFAISAPQIQSHWMSPRIADAARTLQSCPGTLATIPYNEPSLVFLYGRDRTHLATSGEDAADALAADAQCGLALIGPEQEAAFLARAQSLGLAVTVADDISGFNYSNGDELTLVFYRASAAAP